ncbi:MAG: hypothetical protein HYU66_25820, partial [Armatimonadetes bacterium]|nr:hypothetical protein [Armatimonadota bacterium]
DFIAAARLLDRDQTLDLLCRSLRAPETYPYRPAEIRRLVARYRPAIERLRQGFAHRCVEPRQSAGDDIEAYQDLGYLLRLTAHVRAKERQWAEAERCGLDAVELGVAATHGAGLMSAHWARVLQSRGAAAAWDALPHLTAAEAHAASARLRGIRARQVPFWQVVREDGCSALAESVEYLRSTPRGELFRGLSDFDIDDEASFRPWIHRSVLWHRRRTVLRELSDDFSLTVEWAARPYASRGAPPKFRKGSVAVWYLWQPASSSLGHTSGETRLALLQVALCLQAFRREHGAWPVNLEALMPLCLDRLPDDPFAAVGTFGYRREGGGFRLWSVGPDGRDDGGRVIDVDSRGDVVVGVHD